MRITIAATAVAALLLGLGSAFAGVSGPRLHSPGFPPTPVDAGGAIHEPWGVFALRITTPGGAQTTAQWFDETGVPTVVTTSQAGPITMTQTAYRAPIWPGGTDVLAARLQNTGRENAAVVLTASVPETVALGEFLGVAGGRAVLALTADGVRARREERPWGCTGGVVALPGWARPQGSCDPAFSNIRAGMGGVPITYRFAVQPGGKRHVVLGFCESHWAEAGQRPLAIHVEGAPSIDVDPVGKWGQHGPGCLSFDGADADRNGRLEVTIAPHARAADRNTILNVIWIFPPDVTPKTEEVLRGEANEAAEYYVDVGGTKDQSLYKEGSLTYQLTIPAEAAQELIFYLGSPGGGPVPDPRTTTWTPQSLRRAAEEVWAAWRQ